MGPRHSVSEIARIFYILQSCSSHLCYLVKHVINHQWNDQPLVLNDCVQLDVELELSMVRDMQYCLKSHSNSVQGCTDSSSTIHNYLAYIRVESHCGPSVSTTTHVTLARLMIFLIRPWTPGKVWCSLMCHGSSLLSCR